MCIERNIVIFVGLVLIMMFLYKVCSDNMISENFDQDIVPKPVLVVMEERQEGGEVRDPDVRPEIGGLISGPGYEKGEVDGADQEIFSRTLPSNYYFLDDGADGKYSITSNLFSKSCCSAQYPTPFKQAWDPYVCENKDQYVGSNIFGNSTFSDRGCACLNKNQAQFLYNRGGNGREWF
jgi:hypothetical protein